MIDVKDVLSLEFYKKSPFHGSFNGVRYRIEKIEDDNEERKLKCTTWPEPYGFEATDESLMEYYESTFDDEGLKDIVEHINKKAKEVQLTSPSRRRLIQEAYQQQVAYHYLFDIFLLPLLREKSVE